MGDELHYRVSIPFKREGRYKVTRDDTVIGEEVWMFQFPSNGKAYPKWWR